MSKYPDMGNITWNLKLLDTVAAPSRVTALFIEEAHKVCLEARESGSRMDLQTIAKLQFIEKVLGL